MSEREGAIAAPQAALGFPGAVHISINDGIPRGIPGERALTPVDLVNIDVSASRAPTT